MASPASMCDRDLIMWSSLKLLGLRLDLYNKHSRRRGQSSGISTSSLRRTRAMIDANRVIRPLFEEGR
ncbi:hypothetical protein ILYODFUR_002712 [Ilyodon furcidens]|uniref:Ribosomal protein S14 n=2 Tax=Goodeidae TaxID=28758 RepID=A0ABU7ABK9_9TELE|nr:hypothetical protein [Ataeniobius toweri]